MVTVSIIEDRILVLYESKFWIKLILEKTLLCIKLVVFIKKNVFVVSIVSKFSVWNVALVCFLSDEKMLDKKFSASEENEKMFKVFSWDTSDGDIPALDSTKLEVDVVSMIEEDSNVVDVSRPTMRKKSPIKTQTPCSYIY